MVSKRDALRLKPGDFVVFGDKQRTLLCTWVSEGHVVHVTPRGGVKVRTREGAVRWVPYHHIIGKRKDYFGWTRHGKGAA